MQSVLRHKIPICHYCLIDVVMFQVSEERKEIFVMYDSDKVIPIVYLLTNWIRKPNFECSTSKWYISLSFQGISTILVSTSGYALSELEKILKIKQKTFVLLLIRQRFLFFGTLDKFTFDLSTEIQCAASSILRTKKLYSVQRKLSRAWEFCN